MGTLRASPSPEKRCLGSPAEPSLGAQLPHQGSPGGGDPTRQNAIQRIPRFSPQPPHAKRAPLPFLSAQHPGQVGQAAGRPQAERSAVFSSAAGSPRKKSPPRTLLSRSGLRGSSGLAKSRRRVASKGRRPASGLPRQSMAVPVPAPPPPLARLDRRLSDVRGKKSRLKPPPPSSSPLKDQSAATPQPRPREIHSTSLLALTCPGNAPSPAPLFTSRAACGKIDQSDLLFPPSQY